MLAWIRRQEEEKAITESDAARLEHIAAVALHPQHAELELHWETFGRNDKQMLTSVRHLLRLAAD